MIEGLLGLGIILWIWLIVAGILWGFFVPFWIWDIRNDVKEMKERRRAKKETKTHNVPEPPKDREDILGRDREGGRDQQKDTARRDQTKTERVGLQKHNLRRRNEESHHTPAQDRILLLHNTSKGPALASPPVPLLPPSATGGTPAGDFAGRGMRRLTDAKNLLFLRHSQAAGKAKMANTGMTLSLFVRL